MANLEETRTAAKAAPPLPSIGDSGSLDIIIITIDINIVIIINNIIVIVVINITKTITLSTPRCPDQKGEDLPALLWRDSLQTHKAADDVNNDERGIELMDVNDGD